jgi:DNA-binding beta-propeller fold protein YncE
MKRLLELHNMNIKAIVIAFACSLATFAAAAERVVLVAGGGDQTGAAPATQAKLVEPFGIDADRDGNLYLVEMTGHRLSRITKGGQFVPIAGNGKPGDGGDSNSTDGAKAQGAAVQFNGPHALLVSNSGDVYIADTWNHRIRRYDPRTGRIHAFAGSGEKGFEGDGGPATSAKFADPYCLAFDKDERHMFVADLENRRVRAIDMQSGLVTTFAGSGEKGVPEDGAIAKAASLIDARAVAADKVGNVFVLERGGHALRVVDAQGKIRTLAGDGKPGFAGDGGDARRAQLNGPKHLWVDRDGSVLIADTENHAIRRYDPKSGRITLFAGTGKQGSRGVGGPPREVELDRPHGVFVAADGAIYIADSGNGRVLKIERP